MRDFSTQVLSFWFDELQPEQHFVSSPDLDAAISARFLPLYEKLKAQPIDGDSAMADEVLAAILVFDQFPRNMFRGTAQAFATDGLALKLAHQAVQRELDAQIEEARRAFVYMPLMHSELLSDQDLCVAMFARLGGNPHADEHRDVILQFGRFPYRNAALGRPSTKEELAFLEDAARYGQ